MYGRLPIEVIYRSQNRELLLALELTKTIRDNGVIIHEKLITPVPLFLTDEEAIELLFKRIDTDISITTNWAVVQTSALIKAAQSRKEMAKLGTPLEGGSSLKSIAEIGYANICATFERDGFRTGKAYLDARFGGGNRAETAEILGLPTSEKLYPYQILLVTEHPEITGSFLEKLILCDDNGDYIGFVKTETGANLVGYKDRRGKNLANRLSVSTRYLKGGWKKLSRLLSLCVTSYASRVILLGRSCS